MVEQVKDFWPRYWGGVVLFDRGRDFFKALGGGSLLKDKFISGFLLNPRALANYKRAKAMDIDKNFIGEGEIKGGLFIVGSGKTGIAYQFIERNFGDWAPLPEVIEICTQMQVIVIRENLQFEEPKNKFSLVIGFCHIIDAPLIRLKLKLLNLMQNQEGQKESLEP